MPNPERNRWSGSGHCTNLNPNLEFSSVQFGFEPRFRTELQHHYLRPAFAFGGAFFALLVSTAADFLRAAFAFLVSMISSNKFHSPLGEGVFTGARDSESRFVVLGLTITELRQRETDWQRGFTHLNPASMIHLRLPGSLHHSRVLLVVERFCQIVVWVV